MDNTELRQLSNSAYYVSKAGHVYRKLKGLPRHKNNRPIYFRKESDGWYKRLKPGIGGKTNNYLRVELGRSGIFAQVHRLVLLAFDPIVNSDLFQANHKNRNTFDNRLENLEWVTCKENIYHKSQTSLPDTYENLRKDWIDSENNLCKNSDVYIPLELGSWAKKYDMEAIKHELANSNASMKEIATKLGVSFRAVRHWQEKLKIKRPKVTLSHKVSVVLSATPDLTPNQIASKLEVRVTSIHAVLRKLQSVTTSESVGVKRPRNGQDAKRQDIV